MSFQSGIPKKAVPPKCEDCGVSQPMAVLKWGVTIEQTKIEGGAGCFDWLCGSCLFLRDHPDAAPAVALPRERTKRLQKERLFDV